MSYYDEEFYNEPSEFEQQVDEFKQSLLKSVKEEYVTEMERLLAENTELQDVKKNFEQIKNEYRAKERQLENERNDLVRKVRSERLSVLMEDFQVILYKADYEQVQLPKCDKCDEKRRIPYKTPLGKETHEMCECSIGKTVYLPEEHICSEFKLDRDNKKLVTWYKINETRDGEYYDRSSKHVEDKYEEGTEYETLNKYSTFFRSKEECQNYCDWLNARSTIGTNESA